MSEALGTVRRRGDKYCGSKCGRGCTWREYQDARSKGAALATALGPKWTFVVHENLGWYFRAISPCGQVTVHWFGQSRYWADFNANDRQFEAYGRTPRSAVRNAIGRARLLVALTLDALEKVTVPK